MKTKILYILILAVIYSLQINFAQEQQSTGAIPYMKIETSHTIVNTLDNPATIAYAHNSQGGQTLSMPIPAGTPWTTIGSWTAPNFGSSMVKGGNGNYYLTDVTPILFQFNPVSGSVTQLGAITGTSGDQINGISFNPVDGNYYLVSFTNFYSLNISTYAATLIGSMSIAGSLFIDLAFDAAGICYTYDLVTDAAYTINPSTGVATLLGPLGYDANFGQGMSYDMETNTIYLSAFNNGTFTGQLRIMNPSTGSTTLVTDWGLNQLAPFALDTQYGPPCPVGAPSNPNPPNGATNIPLTGNTATWTNGTGTIDVELWFGPAGNIVKVYDGPAITSFALPTLSYSNLYRWYVICKNDTCGTQGSTWSFTTVPDPYLWEWCDNFANLTNWNIIGPLGLTNWSASNTATAGGTAPELRMNWSPSFVGVSTMRSVVIPIFQNNTLVYYSFRFYLDWFANPSGVVTVGITYDGGTTANNLYTVTDPTSNVGPMLVAGSFTTPASGTQNMQIEVTYNGNSFNINWIAFDDMCLLPGFPSPPNTPSNLTAQVIFDPGPKVQLGWQDNSGNETGFRVYRKNGEPNDPGNYSLIGTVAQNITQYLDETVLPESTYTYRVFAYNEYGQSGSNTATIAVPVPVELISFTAEVDGNVATLFWQTATEMNNQGFEIERAPSKSPPKGETSEWQRIGFVEGNGTTTEIQSYSFTDKPEPGKYKYRLKQIDYDGTFAYSPEVEAELKAPNVFSLEQNYPNPFNPTTKIKYTIPASTLNLFSKGEGTFVTLKVYDILGNEVATLVNEEQTPGVYEVEFNVAQVSRPEITSGIYFYQLRTGEFNQTKKMILLK
jgi:hypothetical protein